MWKATLWLAVVIAAGLGPPVAAAGTTGGKMERPNILWITSEDNSVRWLSCYGNELAKTPNLDRLADEGFLYENCFANVPVCAPCRSTWITGIHAVSNGSLPMRSRYNVIAHGQIKYYPDYLRAAGYRCYNPGKTDYNIGGRSDTDCWDQSRIPAWEIKSDKPFFQVVNIGLSHESSLHAKVPQAPVTAGSLASRIKLAKHHPDLPEMRYNYAAYLKYNADMDARVGKILSALAAAGESENTIVIYNSDHGGVLPRSKRFLLDTGLHCPLIVRIPEKFKHVWPVAEPGRRIDRLVSFVDMPKTWLSLAGATVPSHMQGTIFLGPDTEPEPPTHFAYRARMDETHDMVRAVRDKRFLYVRNYFPHTPRGQHIRYLWRQASMQAWEQYHQAGKTDAVTGRFFRPKPFEELYDCQSDPDNVLNLAGDARYAERLTKMRVACHAWQMRVHDAGLLPETEMVSRARANNTTIYEMVRSKELVDLPAYLAAAELVRTATVANLEQIQAHLHHPDPVIRFWGAMACSALEEKALPLADELDQLLGDDAEDTAAAAAAALFWIGKTEKGRASLKGKKGLAETLLKQTYLKD